jgi:hypothetical protein
VYCFQNVAVLEQKQFSTFFLFFSQNLFGVATTTNASKDGGDSHPTESAYGYFNIFAPTKTSIKMTTLFA